MHRFFSPNTDLRQNIISITEQTEIHHLRTVLRLKEGDKVRVFNGRGQEASGPILSCRKDLIEVKTESLESRTGDEKPRIILACAIPKKAKFETIIEKCTELGVTEIIPLMTKRTEVKYEGAKAATKAKRFQAVAVNAAKQCKRRTIPHIHPVTKFTDAVEQMDTRHAAFIPCLGEKRVQFADALHSAYNSSAVVFFIGPEGDFTAEEVALAKKQGCVPVSLGPTVLKVDTAAISVVASINLLRSRFNT